MSADRFAATLGWWVVSGILFLAGPMFFTIPAAMDAPLWVRVLANPIGVILCWACVKAFMRFWRT